MDNKNKKHIASTIIGLILLFIIWGYGGRIIQFTLDVFAPSTIEWQGYVISLGEESRRPYGTGSSKKSLIISNKINPSASLYFKIYGESPVAPKINIESFCNSKDCYSYTNGIVNIDGLDAVFANAKYKVDDNVNIVEFISLPNTNIKIDMKTPITHYESLRKIVNTMKKSQ